MKSRTLVMGAAFLAAALLAVADAAGATLTARMKAQRASASAPIVLGQWHAGFSTVKAYAEANGLPLLAVWSNGENCSHCKKLEGNLLTTYWKNYMKDSGVVYYFGCDEDTSRDDCYGGTGYVWCWKNKSVPLFPFVRFYWKAKKGTVLADGTVLAADKLLVDTAMTGDAFDNYKDVSSKGYNYCIKTAKKMFAKYAYTAAGKYLGGEFGCADTVGSGLQAEVGLTTGSVSVPLTRTNTAVQAQCYTNYLTITYPDGAANTLATETREIPWAAGEVSKSVSVTLPNGYVAGKSITLVLEDEDGAGVATNHIAFVAAQDNSPVNPRWIGEKTASSLGWGEWTMDLDVAKSKVKTSGGTATLVLVSGSQWCPDCTATEKWILETAVFKSWASGQKIACVAIDIPKVDGTGPSLLTYGSYATSERYYTYNYSAVTNEALKVTGGAGYLSRHMIPSEDAAEAAARNWNLFTTAVPDGLCRPECIATSNGKTGKFKTGIPALIVLRPDGTVAGRVYQLNNKSPSEESPVVVWRLKEIVAQIDETAEESNDDASTTTEQISTRETVADRTLSATDQADYYAIEGQAKGQLVTFRLTGDEDETVDVTLSVVSQTEKSGLQTLVTATGNLTNRTGVAVSCVIPSESCYVRVGYPVDKNGYAASDSPFAFDATADTRRAYTLTSDVVLVPGDDGQPADYTINDFADNPCVTMRLTSGQAYKITNLDADEASVQDYLYRGSGEDVYIAKATADAPLKFTQASFQYQKWVTGKISFDPVSRTASESDVFFWLEVARTGGSSGEGRAQVWLDPTTTNHSDLVAFPDNGTNLVWEAGETGAKRLLVLLTDNPYSDGTQKIRFYLSQEEGQSDVGLGASEFRLTLVDNDVAKPGKLGLSARSPLPCADGKLVVRAGSDDNVLLVTRTGGSTGTLKGRVSAKLGTLDSQAVTFESRSAEDVAIAYEAPAKVGVTDVVTIVGEEGAKVDSSARRLKIQTVAENAPQFVQSALVVWARRYVALAPVSVAVDPDYAEAEGAYAVAKTSGSLPAGVKAVFADDALTLSGVPKQAGLYAAAYQLKKGTVAGMTLNVVVYVEDVTVAASWSQTGQPLNPSVKKTRTFSDIMVLDDATARLAGLLTVTLPPTGKASAQYRGLDEGTVRFASANWSSIDDDGTLTAELTATTSGYKSWKFRVTAAADGTVAVEDFSEDCTCLVPNEAYSAAHPATDFQGRYTVSLNPTNATGAVLAQGDGYVTLNLASAAKAKVSYAGLLPNGKAFSGSATLAPCDWDATLATPDWAYARLPLFLRATEDAFSGVLKLERKIAEIYGTISGEVCTRCVARSDAGATPYWRHANAKTDADAYAVTFDALGGKYVATENFVTLIGEAAGALGFFAVEPAAMGETSKYGTPDAWSTNGYGIAVSYDAKKKVNAISAQAKGRATGFTWSFSAATGVVSGSFRLPTDGGADYAPMTFKAVVLPGWGTSNCASCGGTEEANGRPFVCGAAWTTDAVGYDAQGRRRTAKAVRGCAVSVGTQAGK